MTAEKQTFHFPLQFGQGSIQRFAPRIDDYGPLRTQQIEMKADRLTDTPLNTVANHGFSQRAGHRKTDARPRTVWLVQAESRKERSRKAGAFVINSPEIL